MSRAEGWWLVALAVVLFVSNAVVFQVMAFEWGGIIRFAVQFLTIFSIAWVALRRRGAEGVHPRGHSRHVLLAGGWALLVDLVAGWFWVAQADAQQVGWVITTAVVAAAFAPLAWVGWRLVRAGSR